MPPRARARLPREARRQGGAPVVSTARLAIGNRAFGGCLEATLERRARRIEVLRSTEPLGDLRAARRPTRSTTGPTRRPTAPSSPGATRRGRRRRLDHDQLRRRCASARSRIGQALVDRGLSAERPIAILSDNDLEHMSLALGAMWAGMPFVPVSPAYSLVSKDYAKLRYIVDRVTPGLLFASGPAYAAAIAAVGGDDVEVVLTQRRVGGRNDDAFRDAARHRARARQSMPRTPRRSARTPSPSSCSPRDRPRTPRAWSTPTRMMCANQQMLRQALAFLADEPPVLVDWLPWNHTFGGNHNVGLTLYNGGTLYIDEGKPTAKGIATDAAQPARDLADDLLQRAQGLRVPRRGDGRRRGPARVAVPPRPGVHVRRRGPEPGGLGPARPHWPSAPSASASPSSPASA